MKNDFYFINEQVINNSVKLPIFYEDSTITGLLLDNCIRFYKEESFYEVEDINKKRILCAHSYDFIIKNNYIFLSDDYPLLKEYNFDENVYIVICDNFFDIIEKDKITDYLKTFYFEANIECKLLDNKDVKTKRFCTDKPKIKFKQKRTK